MAVSGSKTFLRDHTGYWPQRRPQVRLNDGTERCGHHADNGVRLAAQKQRPADHRRVTREEAQLFLDAAPESAGRVTTIGNGVDIGARTMVIAHQQGEAKRERERGEILKQIKLAQGKLNLAPAIEQELMALTRDREVLQRRYNDLQSKKFNSQMAASLATLGAARAQFAQTLQNGELILGIPLEQALDLVIAFEHGLTELHLANNPELPVGEGRFGKGFAGPEDVDDLLLADGVDAVDVDGASLDDVEALRGGALAEEVIARVERLDEGDVGDGTQIAGGEAGEELAAAERVGDRDLLEFGE